MANAQQVQVMIDDDYVDGIAYLRNLFRKVAPTCEPFPTLTGLATQIDNYIAGLLHDLKRHPLSARVYDEAISQEDIDAAEAILKAESKGIGGSSEEEMQETLDTFQRLVAEMRSLWTARASLNDRVESLERELKAWELASRMRDDGECPTKQEQQQYLDACDSCGGSGSVKVDFEHPQWVPCGCRSGQMAATHEQRNEEAGR